MVMLDLTSVEQVTIHQQDLLPLFHQSPTQPCHIARADAYREVECVVNST